MNRVTLPKKMVTYASGFGGGMSEVKANHGHDYAYHRRDTKNFSIRPGVSYQGTASNVPERAHEFKQRGF
jgi:hypothetical protein